MKKSVTGLLAALTLTGGVMAQDLKVGDKAPAFTPDEWVKGDEVQKFEKGKVYIVEFWATWCGPCIRAFPHLSEIQEKHASDGLTVIGISAETYERGNRDKLVDFVTQSDNGAKMKFPVAYDSDNSMVDDWMKAAERGGIPTSFLVDQDGKIAYIGHPMGGLDEALAKVLAKGGTYTEAKKPEAPKKVAVGSKAPKLAIETWVKGEPITGFEKGRVYVVEFWATWCGPCIGGMPHVSDIQKEYKDKGVTIVGVNIWDDPKKVAGFMEDRGDKPSGDELMGYTVAIETKIDGEDPKKTGVMAKTWMKAAGQGGIPTAFIVDQKGKIAWIGHPMRMDEPLKKVVNGEWDYETAADEAAEKAKAQKAQAKVGELFQSFNELLADGEFKEAYAIANDLVDGALADNAMALNTIAWTIVDPENTPKKQDLKLALKAAKRASELTDDKDPATLDTLAKVYFDKGDLKSALKFQRKAVKNSGGTQFEDELAERLEWYESEAKKRGG